jgi:thioredoxin-like negative regulator of GroEL
MMSITLVAVLQASLLASDGQTYAKAYERSAATGKPLVLLVGAEWCAACQQMKQDVVPDLARRGTLGKVAFAVVDTDEQSKLARKIMRPGVVPQLIMYRRTAKGWSRSELIGRQSTSAVKSFIESGLPARVAARPVAETATDTGG